MTNQTNAQERHSDLRVQEPQAERGAVMWSTYVTSSSLSRSFLPSAKVTVWGGSVKESCISILKRSQKTYVVLNQTYNRGELFLLKSSQTTALVCHRTQMNKPKNCTQMCVTDPRSTWACRFTPLSVCQLYSAQIWDSLPEDARQASS